MILFGASGHAKVIADSLLKSGKTVDFLVDANPEIREFLGYKVINQDAYHPNDDDIVIISIGSNKIRKRLSQDLKVTFGTALHPNTSLAGDVRIGRGSVVMSGAIINSATSIGEHCIINTCASIDHDCKLSDFVHISPNATLCGTVSIGEGTHVGAGATIIPNITIGKWATIGAGAVIIENIPDYAVVVGNPGRIIRYNEH